MTFLDRSSKVIVQLKHLNRGQNAISFLQVNCLLTRTQQFKKKMNFLNYAIKKITLIFRKFTILLDSKQGQIKKLKTHLLSLDFS